MSLTLKGLKDQVMVITGASSGIGFVAARMVAQHGARLVRAASSQEALRHCSINVRMPDMRKKNIGIEPFVLLGLALISVGSGALLFPQRAAAQTAVSMSGGATIGALEQVVAFTGSMPTGVTVSQDGRIFVNFPRWGDPVPFTVAEIKDGRPVAYPNADINQLNTARARDTLISVQSVVVDPRNRLWIIDTGSIELAPIVPDGPKLIGVDLATDRIVKTIQFPPDVVLRTSYLNDIRFDLRKGQDGVAYITDSSATGANGIIVVDLATGASRRRLDNHPSTKAKAEYVPIVEGQPIMQRKPGEPPQSIRMGSDGIAISSDGRRLFYCPLAARRLYSVDCFTVHSPLGDCTASIPTRS